MSLLEARQSQDKKRIKISEAILQKMTSVQWATKLRSTSRMQMVLIHKLVPYPEDKERMKTEEAGHSRLVGGSFNK